MCKVGVVGCCGRLGMVQAFQPVGSQLMEESELVVGVEENLLPQVEHHC